MPVQINLGPPLKTIIVVAVATDHFKCRDVSMMMLCLLFLGVSWCFDPDVVFIVSWCFKRIFGLLQWMIFKCHDIPMSNFLEFIYVVVYLTRCSNIKLFLLIWSFFILHASWTSSQARLIESTLYGRVFYCNSLSDIWRSRSLILQAFMVNYIMDLRCCNIWFEMLRHVYLKCCTRWFNMFH